MNFSINTDVLLNNLMISQKALSNKTPAPYLQGIKLEVYDNEMVMLTSNSDISIKISIKDESLNIEDEGEILIPGKIFVEFVRKLDKGVVSFTVVDNNVLKITSKHTDLSLNLLNVEDYPNIDFALVDGAIKLESQVMKQVIRQTTFATSTIENRPILTGVNIKVENDELIAIATDSFRLSQKKVKTTKNYEKMNVVIPGRSLDELSKVLDLGLEEILIHLNHKSIVFEYGNILFKSRLLDGSFPETSRLIPKEFPVVLKFNANDLAVAVERASLLSVRDSISSIVKLLLKQNKEVEITSNSPEIGKVVEDIDVLDSETSSSLKIAFSSRYFLDALKTFEDQEVSVKFTGEIRPFIIESEKDAGLIQLILPVRTE